MRMKDALELAQTKQASPRHALDAPTKIYVLVELLNRKILVKIYIQENFPFIYEVS